MTGNTQSFGPTIGAAGLGYDDNANLWDGQYFEYGTGFDRKVFRQTFANDNGNTRIIFIQNAINSPNLTELESQSNTVGGKYTVQGDFDLLPFEGCSAPTPVPPSNEEDITEDEAEAIASTSGIDYLFFDEVADYGDRAYLYRLIEENPNLFIGNSYIATFYDDMSEENLALLQTYERTLAALGDTSVVVDSIYIDSLMSLSAAIKLSIVDNNKLFENADKFILTMQENMLTKGLQSITPFEKEQINTLAIACPAQVGTCVYKARSLNAFFRPAAAYSDFDICAASLPQNKGGKSIYDEGDELLVGFAEIANTTKGNNIFNVYPNPILVGEDLTVNYTLQHAGLGQIVITDLVGKIVQTLNISSTVQKVSFKLEGLTKGIYTIGIVQEGRLLNSSLVNVQ